jgi:hypothetical protein
MRITHCRSHRFSPEYARRLLDRAKPIEWRSLPEYRLPVFGRFNAFDRLISRGSEYAWWASSHKCAVDRKLGYDDNYSIRIQHGRAEDKSAWYAWTWGPCYDSVAPLEGRYRFSAMVKTERCTLPFRLAVAEFLGDLWLCEGNPNWTTNPGWPDKVIWHYSPKQVAGAADWTRVTIDLTIDNEPFKAISQPFYVRRAVALQYEGEGTIWFDNVRIDKME